MAGVEVGGFLKDIPGENESGWKTLFPWMKEGAGKKNVTAACSGGRLQDSGISRVQEDQRKTQAVEWVITTLSEGLEVTLVKSKETPST